MEDFSHVVSNFSDNKETQEHYTKVFDLIQKGTEDSTLVFLNRLTEIYSLGLITAFMAMQNDTDIQQAIILNHEQTAREVSKVLLRNCEITSVQ